MKSVQSEGVEWRYHVAGNGSCTILLLAGSLGTNEGTASIVSEYLPFARIVMPEYSPVDTIAEFLDALDRIVKEERLDHIALYGGSFGGLIAQCWARRHPELVSHLILSGTGVPDRRRLRKHRNALLSLPAIPLPLIRMILRLLIRKLLRNSADLRWFLEYQKLASQLTKGDLASRYKVARDLDANYVFRSDELPESMKILILEGEKDSIAKQSVRDQLRSLYPHAQSHVFANAGHSAMMTNTAEWSQVVKDFLQKS